MHTILANAVQELTITHVNHVINTGINRALQGIHRSREQVCDKHGSMIHTYISHAQLFRVRGRCHAGSMWSSLRLAIITEKMMCSLFLDCQQSNHSHQSTITEQFDNQKSTIQSYRVYINTHNQLPTIDYM